MTTAKAELHEKVQDQDSEMTRLKQMNSELQNELSQHHQQMTIARAELQEKVQNQSSEIVRLKQMNFELQNELSLKLRMANESKQVGTCVYMCCVGVCIIVFLCVRAHVFVHICMRVHACVHAHVLVCE